MTAKIPSHIPPERVVAFDRFLAPELKSCPHQRVTALFHGSPDIFYTTGDRGHWVVGRANVARDMLRQPDKFSSDPKFNPANARKPPTLPNQCDPPLHTDLRRIINPFFSPAGVQKMEHDVRRLAGELIDEVAVQGGCEFVRAIAQRFPVELFMRMAKAPFSPVHSRHTGSAQNRRRRCRTPGIAKGLFHVGRPFAPGSQCLCGCLAAGCMGRAILVAVDKMKLYAHTGYPFCSTSSDFLLDQEV